MDNTRKIREIYNCVAIVSDEQLYPLQKWYNQLIEKAADEIAMADVLKMIRQKIFVDLAMSTAIKFLEVDVFAGESYDGELLERLSEMESTFLKPYADDLKIIVKNVLEKSATHEWSYDGEEEELEEAADSISNKIM